eukprot:5239733-Pyramimonas_sp.AAC.1
MASSTLINCKSLVLAPPADRLKSKAGPSPTPPELLLSMIALLRSDTGRRSLRRTRANVPSSAIKRCPPSGFVNELAY